MTKNAGKPKATACPICGAPRRPETTPFCSRRCSEIDLHRWLSGSYAITTDETDAEAAGEAGEGEDRG